MKKDFLPGSKRFCTLNKGFTLIELVISLAIGMVLLMAMYSVFEIQRKTLQVQEQVAELQQAVRAGMDMMIRDIRMAGYDPAGTAGAGIVAVDSGGSRIYITMDLNGDGDLSDSASTAEDTGEHVVYDLYNNKLGRAVGHSDINLSQSIGHQPVVENIETLSFTYDTASQAVTISLTGRTAQPDPKYTDPVYKDHYRRYTLQTSLIARNLLATAP
ncbi:MAG: prepilin-type N-terminal cleavage/methylation domain-containing protein [Syntrophales bacterium]|jgi:type IV pilus assembly protein PilW|nr:prepilin-type N-terminal cleavage/methylation domain-containing protein [Syntrophales bacterium]MDY0044591.1 prepilin-type N-terminal cleavage/methylation domain-containing protein [Syntrophales bacterium]